MNTYLLLRNNKESGPHSLEEIRALALKAYDLVWVVGKSAAWRYPGEIEELKSFAPPIEEQPFDRFFKKPVRESLGSDITNNQGKQDKPFPTQKKAGSSGSVYINLPASKKIVEERIVFVEPKKSLSEIPAETRPEYYAFPEKKKKNTALMAVAILLLFGAGFATGIIINNRGISSSKKEIGQLPVQNVSTQRLQAVSLKETTVIPATKILPDQTASSDGPVAAVKEITPADKSLKKKSRPAVSNASDSIRSLKNGTTGATADSVTVNQSNTNKNASPVKDPLRTNIEDYVYLTAGKYSVGAFGGISNVQLTVSNEAAIPLDLVVVEVQYILSSKKLFKTENIYFHNIPAGSSLMQEAPKSPRGIKVRSRITMINSKQTGLSFTDM